MYAINAPFSPTSSITPTPSVASAIVSETPVIGRIPVTHVAAPIADVRVGSESKNSAAYASAKAEIETPAAASSAFNGLLGPAPGGVIHSFPTLFMAHILGQQPPDPQASGLIMSYQPENIPKLPQVTPEQTNPMSIFSHVLETQAHASKTDNSLSAKLASMQEDAVSESSFFATTTLAQTPLSGMALKSFNELKKPILPSGIGNKAYSASTALFSDGAKELLIA